MVDANTHPDHGKPLDAADREVFAASSTKTVLDVLAACPKHRPTPLHSLPALAGALRVATLHVKDESARLGLGSFKALGGAYAVIRLVLEEAERRLGQKIAPAALRDPDVQAVAKTFTVACATDGNHGRSVAAGARLVGCRANIFVHEGVDQERVDAIANFGATMIRVPGTYDDAVAEAERVSLREGWTIVSDTSWPGYERVAGLVMQGYTAMVAEILDAIPVLPTHVFLQAGVGGFAAAVGACLSVRLGERCPRIVIVEPDRAACLLASHRAGALTKIQHGEPTVMAMLECYEPSLVAWRILSRLADAFMTVTDRQGIEAMKMLAYPRGGDPAIEAGESGGAGLAGLMAIADDERARATIALQPTSRVLLINTEGATAPATYRKLIGSP